MDQITIADLSQAHTWKECISERVRSEAKAFCSNCNRFPDHTYKVRGLSGEVYEAKSAKGIDCPKCGHALFWSRQYQQVISQERYEPKVGL